MFRTLSAAVVAAFAFMGPVSATTVSLGFEGLGSQGPTGTLVTAEDGFTLEFVNMFLDLDTDGTDGPTEVERQALGAGDGTLTVTRPGSPFSFSSIDWQAESGSPSISILGFFGGVLVGTDTFTSSSTDYQTFNASVLAGLSLDELVISADRFTGTLGAFDALVLGDTPPVVPLPASALLLLSGLGGLAAWRRRRG